MNHAFLGTMLFLVSFISALKNYILSLPRDRSMYLTKEARIYNGKKTTSLTSGAGKMGQPLAKE